MDIKQLTKEEFDALSPGRYNVRIDGIPPVGTQLYVDISDRIDVRQKERWVNSYVSVHSFHWRIPRRGYLYMGMFPLWMKL